MRWPDLDLERRIWRPTPSVQRLRGELDPATGRRTGRLVAKELKSQASPQPIALPRSIVEALEKWELALASQAANGRPVPEDVRGLLANMAINEPATAARCRRIMRVIGPEVAAAVVKLAGRQGRPGVTPLARLASQPPASEVTGRGQMTVAEAARALTVGHPAVRAACAGAAWPRPGTRAAAG